MRIKILALFILFAVLGCACNSTCRQGAGPVEEERREPGSFTSVIIDIPVTVVIKKGDSPEIKLSAPGNILEILSTDVSNGRLRIESDKCFTTDVPVRIEIRATDLSRLELSGSGTVTVSDTFQVKEATFELSGSGTIEARMIASVIDAKISGSGTMKLIGSVNDLNVTVSGSGGIDASAIPCNKADADVSGSGSIHIYALEKVRAVIAGSGNIYYKGNPDIKSDISGSGKMISDN